MKYIFIYIIFVLNSSAGEIQIKLQNLNGEKGQIGISIFSKSNARGFPKDDDLAYYGGFFNLSEFPLTIQVPSNDDYAVTLFLDKNYDRKLNTKGLLGIPSEPFGFSNNPKLIFGPPTFNSAKFSVGGGKNDKFKAQEILILSITTIHIDINPRVR